MNTLKPINSRRYQHNSVHKSEVTEADYMSLLVQA